jgi:hypothetical protein
MYKDVSGLLQQDVALASIATATKLVAAHF